MSVKNGTEANAANATIEALGAILADSIDLALATKQAHWNIKGPRFIALHEMLDGFRTELDRHVDEIAERILQVGGTALGTVSAVAKTRLASYPTDIQNEHAHLTALTERYSALARTVRNEIAQIAATGDANSADILTGYSRALENSLWLLRAHQHGE